MENKIIITTTNSIENTEIEKYLELISTNVVVGTNMFSDIGASLTDIFGGFSHSYQDKLQEIHIRAIENLKQKAVNIGANAILGLKIDFDEISGKGKTMFMISALGTAVRIKITNENLETNDNLMISNLKLEQEILKQNIISKFQNDNLPSQEEWIYLLNNPIEEILELLLDRYLENHNKSSNEFDKGVKLLLTHTGNYFKIIDKEIAIKTLYGKLIDKPFAIFAIIEMNDLFDSAEIIKLIVNNKINMAVTCLSVNKSYYSKSDLNLMNQIIELLSNLPDKGKIQTFKVIIGKAKDKYICQNGHSNNINVEFCENYKCSENIKGLTLDNLKQIEKFKTRIKSLSSLICYS